MLRPMVHRGVTCLLIAAVTMLQASATAAPVRVPSMQSVKWTQKQLGQVEVIQGQAGNILMESRTDGSRMLSTLRSGKHVEVVEVDQNSPFFTITVDGKSTTYDRRDYLVEERGLDDPRLSTDRPMATPMSSGIQDELESRFGSPYYDSWLASRTVYQPFKVKALLTESYDWYITDQRSYRFDAWTWIALIVGVTGISFRGVLAIAGAYVTVHDAVPVISKALRVNLDAVRCDWNRNVTVNQDPTDGIWYWAGRSEGWKVGFSMTGITYERNMSRAHRDFYRTASLLETGTRNYLRSLGY